MLSDNDIKKIEELIRRNTNNIYLTVSNQLRKIIEANKTYTEEKDRMLLTLLEKIEDRITKTEEVLINTGLAIRPQQSSKLDQPN